MSGAQIDSNNNKNSGRKSRDTRYIIAYTQCMYKMQALWSNRGENLGPTNGRIMGIMQRIFSSHNVKEISLRGPEFSDPLCVSNSSSVKGQIMYKCRFRRPPTNSKIKQRLK